MNEFFLILIFGFVVLGPLIFVHELGHFLVAKALGVRVLSFSIGMGPRVLGFTRGGTDYRISLLPIGGYVRMAGESPESEDRSGDPGEFVEKPWWARALITAAGPLANLVFALVLNTAVLLIGVSVPDYAAVVGHVRPGSVVEQIGIRDHDQIVSVDGRKAATMLELSSALSRVESDKRPGTVNLTVERKGSRVALALPRSDARSLGEELDWKTGTTIGRVFVGYPAYLAGLREGDEILKVDGHAVQSWSELSERIRRAPDTQISLTVRRGDQTYEVPVRTTPDSLIGIALPESITVRQAYPAGEAIPLGLQQTWYGIRQIYSGLASFVLHPVRLRENVAGPIAIAQVAREQARGGFDQLLAFASFISLALMAMNLLPIPILDGGHIFFALLEAVRRRPISLRTQMMCQRVGLAVLAGLVVFSFANDLTRVTQRNRAEADISRRLQTPAPTDTARSPGGP
jgi:regulator of sigma E protease